MDSLARLKRYMNDNAPLILDGGLATELAEQGANLQGDPLWGSGLLYTNPQIIRDVHHRFLVSGADVISTATYQASVPGFMDHLNLSSERARELLMSGVHLAKESVERFVSECHHTGRMHPLVAGSVGPYGAILLDGSEYTGAYAAKMSIEEFKDWHRPRIECLAAAGADLFAMETIPSTKEAQALIELLREFPNSNAWLSFSCKDQTCIADGSPFTSAVQLANRSSQLVAVGVNCCSPLLVEPLLESGQSLRRPDLSWVVYPNSGEEWVREQGWLPSDKESLLLPDLSCKWMKQGAALIGGCCRIRPAHIAELRKQLKRGSTSTGDKPPPL
ncbi:homocysteine S-methyltransferase [Antennarius striatus]|uniref:homocysteine S-methyltransferase n=1 Tax=Antennarius striatus TaxID=241820 RepID=UPI0035AFCB2A